jgi:hypothetical protein
MTSGSSPWTPSKLETATMLMEAPDEKQQAERRNPLARRVRLDP